MQALHAQVGLCFAQYIGILIVISIATWQFVFALPVISVVYWRLQRYYIPGARELQRLEAVTRSPIYSGFAEAVNGLATIRAFRRQARTAGQRGCLSAIRREELWDGNSERGGLVDGPRHH